MENDSTSSARHEEQPEDLPSSTLSDLPDYEEHIAELKRGSKVLSSTSYESRHKSVESSFNKARKQGEKLPGKNNERRNYSYLSRLEQLIAKHGNPIEKKLWKESSRRLIIQEDEIPESYWRSQEQILRDEGHGDYGIDRVAKTAEIQRLQEESLASRANYLGSENSPYPTWFKVYAWDGMSKMGVFDKDKQQFAKRDKHTVAPYPKLNPAVLAKTYGLVKDFYDQPDNDRHHQERSAEDAELEALVKSGNFNKLYSKILLSEKAIPKTPERTEDVHGEWVEYLPGEEEHLASAAEGTPWCIADSGTGRNYLKYGNYGGYYEYNGPGNNSASNQAKFILFHLQNPETNTLSESACASIRLGTDGRVAEISGLNEGQALEDSLVPIVEEKVRSLPGGEDFLEAFADKKQLIALDRKMQNNEDLTKEELEFIYEINRPIKTLDTYNKSDPRIPELRQKYGIGYALDHGVNIDGLVSQLDSHQIAKNLDALLDHGANIDNLVSQLLPHQIAFNLDTLLDHGANININDLVSQLLPHQIAKNLDALLDHGANININNLISYYLDSYDIVYNLDTLLDHGANIDGLVSQLGPYMIAKNLDALLDHGANINNLISRLDSYGIVYNLDTLLDHGANIDNLVSRLDPDDVLKHRETLIKHGANI